MNHGYLYDLLREIGLSDFAASTGEFVLEKPVRILLTLLAALIITRISVRAVRRSVQALSKRTPSRLVTIRSEQRISTIGDVLGNIVRAAVWTVAGLIVLDEFDVNLAPLLAGAGIAGIAIGFGAQTLVKDFLSGLFILIEDQYGVGDVVTLGDATGTVEDLGLRVTRVRSMEGTVYFVPNGEIRKVGNASMEWSRALIDTTVAADADVAAVSASIAEEARAVADDEQYRGMVLDAPELWGVQSMTPDGVTIRLTVKTAPRQQWLVARELRSRIVRRLRQEGVGGPAGKALVVSGGQLDLGAPVAAGR